MTTRPLTLGRGVLLAALALATILAGPASAHDGDPVITVDQAHPADGSTHYFVKVVYSDDGDPVNGLSLTATPIAPDGTEGALVTMTGAGEGIYQGEVPMASPGTWKVRFTSVDPPGSLEHTQVVAGPTTTAAPSTTATTAAPETTAPPTSAADTDTDIDTEETAADSDDDSSSALPLIIGAVVLLLAVGGGAAYAMSRRKAATEPADDSTDAPV